MYEILKPKSELLKKYISEITVLKKNSSFPKEYVAFPHKIAAIIFFQFGTIKYDRYYLKINKSQTKTPIILAMGKYIEPLLVSYNQYIDEISINFTPTGINYFFDENFCDIAKEPMQLIKNEKWKAFSKVLFKTSKEELLSVIESFLEQRFKEKDLQLIENIIDSIENDKSLKFKDISKQYSISGKTINRLFHKYIGCSPKDYKKISRFRGAINEYNAEESNLTQLCLNNDYYDSPHFTKEFKRLTNKNPREYFKSFRFVYKDKFPYIFK